MTLLLIVATAAAAAAADQGSAGAGAAEPADGTAAGAGSAAAAPSVAAAEGAGFPPHRRARECKMRSPYLLTFTPSLVAKQLAGRKHNTVRAILCLFGNGFFPLVWFLVCGSLGLVCVFVRTHR